MIRRLMFVACDRCGKPCGTGDDMADDASTARLIASRRGWTRYMRLDLCPDCVDQTAYEKTHRVG